MQNRVTSNSSRHARVHASFGAVMSRHTIARVCVSECAEQYVCAVVFVRAGLVLFHASDTLLCHYCFIIRLVYDMCGKLLAVKSTKLNNAQICCDWGLENARVVAVIRFVNRTGNGYTVVMVICLWK